MKLTPEILFYLLLILMVLFTRFYDLGSRVMSHDESLHTQFSWYLEQGRGFSHDPLMHGPLQMHLVAFSYFLFGDSDASARAPAAISGVLAVVLVLLFRRWLGRWGTAAAASLMAFSPYMLYYSRYVRNESLIVPMALLMFYAVFRYVEDSQPKWLYLLAAALALQFTAKETAFIYTAQLLVFLGLLFALRVLRMQWQQNHHRWLFISGLGIGGLGGVLAIGSLFRGWAASGEAAAATVPGTGEALASGVQMSPLVPMGLLLALGGAALMVA
ncbi:MAG: flippase activity-associated protein Agl23, partial [Anaerolineales bacterium]